MQFIHNLNKISVNPKWSKYLSYAPHLITSILSSYWWTTLKHQPLTTALPLLGIGSLFVFSLSKALLREVLVSLYRSSPQSPRDTCLITGATHGIGFDIAKMFARDGYNLILVARYEEELETAKQQLLALNENIRIFTIPKDLYSEHGADELFNEARVIEGTNNVRINYLINNVGVFLRGAFLELPLVDQLGMIRLNIGTTTKLSYYFGNEFKNQIERHPNENTTYKILITSSFVSLVSCPFLTVYSATKAFVHSLALSFNEELKASKYQGKITCTALCPGYTITPAFVPNGLLQSVALALKNFDSPPRVARNGYYSLMNKETYILVR
eukprot:TRINITY_DN3570_c0_g1_i11.p1 TRINITY_DN3570_c0_g1~~TRINITY_DN3570_c0_g1_i11.p1  ORF type:complete len:328 (-),score=46.43 TRINITY_DN3570_c0_g1_i11:384-1367(-)